MTLPGFIKTRVAHCAALLTIGLSAFAGGTPATPGVMPPDAKVHGVAYAEWGVAWWQWAWSIPYNQNPNYDSTGDSDGMGQSGPVWFLPVTGAFGGVKERAVTVPRGKHVLVPTAIGSLSYPCAADPSFQPGVGQTVENFLASIVDPIFDYVEGLITSGSMTAEVDGRPVKELQAYRAASDLFDLVGDPSLVAADPCVSGTAQPTISDGYWLLLAPLSKGQHTVHYRIQGDALPGGGEEVTFQINVE
jgi:hypothetical protein